MSAISTHPSLRTLVFEGIGDDPSVKRDRTEAVAEMLLANQQVDEISFDDYTFDQDLWNTLVVPRLECNLYRKRFVPLQKIQVPSIRAAIVARALAHVAENPSLVWMALSQNRDVLLEYLDDASTDDNSVLVTSRKRSHSSFEDDSVCDHGE
jgi:hypothetical protein